MLPYTACADAGFTDETNPDNTTTAVNPINLDRNIRDFSLRSGSQLR